MPRVLIVDDHASFRATARQLLEAEGYEVVVGEAGDGASALEAVARLQPDIVLLDVQLPDMDGFEISRRLCGNGASPKIVLTSSRPIADLRRRVGDSPAAGFLPKDLVSGATLLGLAG